MNKLKQGLANVFQVIAKYCIMGVIGVSIIMLIALAISNSELISLGFTAASSIVVGIWWKYHKEQEKLRLNKKFPKSEETESEEEKQKGFNAEFFDMYYDIQETLLTGIITIEAGVFAACSELINLHWFNKSILIFFIMAFVLIAYLFIVFSFKAVNNRYTIINKRQCVEGDKDETFNGGYSDEELDLLCGIS